jgi:hypothetical protein
MLDTLVRDLGNPGNGFALQTRENAVAGIYIDLNGDKSDEFVLLTAYRGLVYENQAGHWMLAGNIVLMSTGQPGADFNRTVIRELTQGNVSALTPKWSELSVGGRVYRVNPVRSDANVK